MLAGGNCRRLEPDLFLRVILVGDEGDNVVPACQEQVEAGVAHLAVAEEQDPGCRGHKSPGFVSSISLTKYCWRARTTW